MTWLSPNNSRVVGGAGRPSVLAVVTFDIEETFPQSPVRLESLQKPMPTLRIFQGEPHEMWLVVAQVR
jgi:hypothetical protein